MPNYKRIEHLRHRYGMEWADYVSKLEAQGGGCAICGTADPGMGNIHFAVDHDHACCAGKKSCGKCVRGLLCHRCNTVRVPTMEAPETALATLRYLERWGKFLEDGKPEELEKMISAAWSKAGLI